MGTNDFVGIILIGVILLISAMADNPEDGMDMLGGLFDGIKDFVRWLNRQ